MDRITFEDKTFVKYIPGAAIDAAITSMARRINEDYKEDQPVFLITLNGALFFAVDLLKQIKPEIYITTVKLSSYHGTTNSPEIKNVIGINENLKGKRVIILEDIVDTGATYEYLVNKLNEQEVKDIRMATLTFKPDCYTRPYPVHYAAFSIPPKFVIGRGLDYDGLGRNLPDIYQILV